jgi:putative phosphoribosyl transferase
MEKPTADRQPHGTPFADRRQAGHQLALALAAYRGQDVLVLGIPRGGVPVADVVAEQLEADLDLVVARKLGAPGWPELAIGAVTANGGRFLNQDVIGELGVRPAYLAAVTAAEMTEARAREERLRDGLPARPIAGRVVIVVDDGLATGATMRAAVRSVRQQRPARLVVAVPVGSRTACAALRAEVDDLVCLAAPEPFWAVGAYYEHFEPTDDDEVRHLLHEADARRQRRSAPAAARAGD